MKKTELKKCTECGEEKLITEFWKNHKGKDGLSAKCIKCMTEYHKKYGKINQNKIKAEKKIYNDKHREERKIKAREAYKKNRKKLLAQKKIYCQTNKKKIKIAYEKWRKSNKDYLRQYTNKKRKTEPKTKLNHNISNHVRYSLKGNKNGNHWENVLGYTLNKLKKHLEKQFVNGMTWDNYGKDGWVIDHKIPIAVFNYEKPEHRDFKRCWALNNLQPMWEKENIIKSDKLDKHFQPSLRL